jgi:hypothetical protein
VGTSYKAGLLQVSVLKRPASSQLVWSIAAPSCNGSCQASRQSIRDGIRSAKSQWIQQHYSDNEQVRTGLHREAASLSPPTGTADCESVHVTSRPPRRTGPIASFPAQPSRKASTALLSSNGLNSVQYSDGLQLARTSYHQRPFQGLPRTFGMWHAWSYNGDPNGE